MNDNLPSWNKDASELLAQFLATGTGQVFLTLLSAARPGLLRGATLEQTALRACEVDGFEVCYREILRMATPPQDNAQTETPSFPDIDNEAAWDGDKPKTP